MTNAKILGGGKKHEIDTDTCLATLFESTRISCEICDAQKSKVNRGYKKLGEYKSEAQILINV